MPSWFGWIDHSEQHRRRMLDVLDLFGEQGTRDELGVAAIRDAFADMLFPGTGTLQTRARYFLFVPWMYQDLEARRIPASEVARRARKAEIALIESLLQSPDIEGTIGRISRAKLQRVPSNIYWSGLGRLGFLRFPGSQDQYHRSLDHFYRLQRGVVRTDDGDLMHGVPVNWDPALPAAPAGFPEEACFRLTRDEALYLRGRIMESASCSLLAFLIDRGQQEEVAKFPWEHPQWNRFPSHIQEQLYHARAFSEVIHGAPLLYNLMLAELRDHKEWTEHYRERLEEWAAVMARRSGEFASWDRRQFWAVVESGGGCPSVRTRLFVDTWLTLVLGDEGPARVAESERARRLIRDRECALKGQLARLENPRARVLWNGAAGTQRLAYRWPNAAVVAADILQGVTGGSDA